MLRFFIFARTHGGGKCRWGWKIPKTIYQLDRLLSMYPGLLFIHVLRNPLDMSATFFEHLQARSHEFSQLHGGDAQAANLMERRCQGFVRPPPTNPSCALTASELQKMRTCVHGNPEKCGVNPSRSGGWRCMEMMLWAEMNSAVRAFGERCLSPHTQYVLWHGEDDYALRGSAQQRKLQLHVASALNIPVTAVVDAFPTALHNQTQLHPQRRLGFGKYKTSKLSQAKLVKCAESANTRALVDFEYLKGARIVA